MQENLSSFISQTPFIEHPNAPLAPFSRRKLIRALNFHRSIPGYAPTPLYTLLAPLQKLSVKNIYLKDGSQRFGLKALKVLGGSYAMAHRTAELVSKDISGLSFDVMTSEEVHRDPQTVIFTTTADGNRGRDVAWAVRQLKQSAVAYMPRGPPQQHLTPIRNEGATAGIVNMNYDDAARMTAEQVERYGWIMVQDIAWEGYKKTLQWIMQGYDTLMLEAIDQLYQIAPTHISVQASTGSFAGMVQGMVTAVWGKNCPRVIVAEALIADRLYRSAYSKEGDAIAVDDDLQTVTTGLACDEVNSIDWKLPCDYVNTFVSCPDEVTASDMRMLDNPLAGDPQTVPGELGAVITSLLVLLMISPELAQTREWLGLGTYSRVLLVNTKGDTDPQQYLGTIWGGQYPGINK